MYMNCILDILYKLYSIQLYNQLYVYFIVFSFLYILTITNIHNDILQLSYIYFIPTKVVIPAK